MWRGVGELSSGLADFYRDLHRHPELSLEEHRSAKLIAGALRPLGFEVTENVGGTGVVGLVRNGDGVVEPTLTTGIQALTLAARTWLRTGAPQQGRPAAVQASRQAADPVTAARAPGGSQGTS
jgi:hippurate hydrolase